MVIWVFAGGGESEIEGLLPFLSTSYSQHSFERKAPVRIKPGPKPPPKIQPGYGLTGSSFTKQIGIILQNAFTRGHSCDLLLIIDDLDCHAMLERQEHFQAAIDEISDADNIERLICFASPEIEAWIIADWQNTLAADADFRQYHASMRHWLSTQANVSFENPEDFSEYAPSKNACTEKLSNVLIAASKLHPDCTTYSKSLHTPRFVKGISPDTVSQKCPLFRILHTNLSRQN